jgi:hypothetical protein
MDVEGFEANIIMGAGVSFVPSAHPAKMLAHVHHLQICMHVLAHS